MEMSNPLRPVDARLLQRVWYRRASVAEEETEQPLWSLSYAMGHRPQFDYTARLRPFRATWHRTDAALAVGAVVGIGGELDRSRISRCPKSRRLARITRLRKLRRRADPCTRAKIRLWEVEVP